MTENNYIECNELNQPFPLSAHMCRRGNYIMIKNYPCKITDVKVSKGHNIGHAKLCLIGADLITGITYSNTCHQSWIVDSFLLTKIDYNMVKIVDKNLHLENELGEEKVFKLLDTELYNKLIEDFANGKNLRVTVLYAPKLVNEKYLAIAHIESYKERNA